MKYIAVFDVPDNYVIGAAVGMMCPNDGKIREDKDFEKVYAQIEPLDREKEEAWNRFNQISRALCDLGIHNAYNRPSFWCNGGKDYKVIETKYHAGYDQALKDVESALRKMFGFAEHKDIGLQGPF